MILSSLQPTRLQLKSKVVVFVMYVAKPTGLGFECERKAKLMSFSSGTLTKGADIIVLQWIFFKERMRG